MEVWKAIEGYEEAYEVSNQGRVKNKRTGKVLAIGYAKTSRYPCVVLSQNGEKRTHSIHRLVAKAFIPNPNSLPEVNHKNEDRTDNRVENLEWCTRYYNIHYGTGIVRKALATRNNRRSIPIVQVDLNGNIISEYPSMHEMERQTGFHRSFVKKCLNGSQKTAYGYKWQYAIEQINLVSENK